MVLHVYLPVFDPAVSDNLKHVNYFLFVKEGFFFNPPRYINVKVVLTEVGELSITYIYMAGAFNKLIVTRITLRIGGVYTDRLHLRNACSFVDH